MVLDFVDLPEKDPDREMRFSEKMACPNEHAIDTDELEPRSFSFNSPFGACPSCTGLGTRMEVDPELVVPDPTATLAEGALQPWSHAHVADYFGKLVQALGEELGFDMDTPWEQLPAKAQKAVLDGHPTKVHVVTKNRYGRQRSYYADFEGVRSYVERRHREAESDVSRERFEGFMREVPCPVCEGSRLKPVSMSVTLGPKTAPDGGRAARTSPRCARCRSTRRPTTCATSTCPPVSGRSASGCSRRSRSACSSCSTSASTT